jgi:hypothetical protein
MNKNSPGAISISREGQITPASRSKPPEIPPLPLTSLGKPSQRPDATQPAAQSVPTKVVSKPPNPSVRSQENAKPQVVFNGEEMPLHELDPKLVPPEQHEAVLSKILDRVSALNERIELMQHSLAFQKENIREPVEAKNNFQQQRPPNIKPELLYAHQLREMDMMGFKDSSANLAALIAANGDTQAAVNLLVEPIIR